MGNLTIIDIIVIFVYLGGITYIGIYTSRKIKNSEDFFMGSRQFKKFNMIMYQFGSGTSADSAVSASSKIYTNGISGIWYLWMYLPVTPFFWLIAPILRRMRALTIGDFFESRFDKSISSLYALIGVILQMVNIGVILKGTGSLLKATTGGTIPVDWAIIIMTVLFLFYGMAGGLAAAVITDLIQGILTIIFSVILIPFALNAVGGMEGIRQGISDPALLSLVAPSDIGVFYILMGSIALLVGIGTLPHHMGVCGAGRTELDGRIGFTYGSFLKRAATIAWAVVALAAIVMFAGESVKPDEVFGKVAHTFLPNLGYGILGIFIATFLSAIMSTCDNAMLSASALFTSNIYRPYIKKDASQSHYVNVGRASAFFVVAGGIGVAYALPGVIKGVELMWIIPSLLGISFWLGYIWRGMTVKGVWAATIAAFLVWWLSDQQVFINWLDQTFPFLSSINFITVRNYNDVIVKGIYFPWQIVFYLTVGFVVGIVVSLFTKKVPEDQLNHFYGLMRTPVNEPEELTENAQLPKGKDYAPQNKLINLPGIELQVPSKQAIGGFFVAVFFVLLLVGSLLWIVAA